MILSEELKRIEIARGWKTGGRETMQLAMQVLLDASSVNACCASIKQYGAVFKRIVGENENKASTFMQCLENVIARRNHGMLIRQTYKVLFAVYEAQVVSVEHMLSWYAHITSDMISKREQQAIRNKARTTVQWLKVEDQE